MIYFGQYLHCPGLKPFQLLLYFPRLLVQGVMLVCSGVRWLYAHFHNTRKDISVLKDFWQQRLKTILSVQSLERKCPMKQATLDMMTQWHDLLWEHHMMCLCVFPGGNQWNRRGLRFIPRPHSFLQSCLLLEDIHGLFRWPNSTYQAVHWVNWIKTV